MIIVNCVDSLRLRSPITEVLTLGGSPKLSGWLLNPLKYSQAANMQSAHNLSVSNADSQNLRVSFSYAVNLRSSLSGAQKEKDSTANATLWRYSDLLYEELQELKNLISLRDLVRLPDNIGLVSYCSINLPSLRGGVNQGNNIDLVGYCSDNHVNNVHSVSYCSDDALALRWRRLISPFIAVTIKPALLSSSLLTFSISSITSWGMRTVVICDFAFFAPVAITESSIFRCMSVYIKNKLKKVLTFISPMDKVKYTLRNSRQKKATPRSAANTIEASNHNVKESYAMDTPQHTQTRLKFTFLIASGNQRLVDIHPVRLITVLADCEGEARLLAGISSLVFVSRQGVSHA
ncbi:hypothetical protein Xkoz_03657 [Xenorhabdus kozodoii]|uniref:Uncharacterized protein n=2 Tax=Xenorhabdus kozodoii TaxID=351676 RepID=A0A2D0KYS4_9GAMM|nr:hypothetical protein Xkoz_03657 [Xenorhabdus kozodoii]